MTERFNPHAAAIVFLIKDTKILLMRRFNTGWGDGLFTAPSGHIEAGESASVAAIRETLEEVGVSIESKNLQPAHTMHRKNEQGSVYVDFFFVATEWSGVPKNSEPNKCDLVEWHNLDNLPENTVPFVRAALDKYRNSIPFSEFGWVTK